jgi:hypothetical protein
MIKKLACASAVAATLLAAAPAAQAADAARRPAPDSAVPGAALLTSLLGSLEMGNPVTSLTTLLPEGVRGR